MRSQLARILSSKLVGSGVASLLIKTAGAALGYAMFVVFARLMTPDEYGRFAFGLNLAIVAGAVGGLGFNTGILRYWPQYTVAKDGSGARGVVEMGYLSALGSGLVILAIAAAIGFLAPWLGAGFSFSEAIAVGFLGVVIAFGDYSTNLLRALGSTVMSMFPRDVVWRVLAPLTALLLLWAGGAVTAVAALAICAALLALLTAWQGLHGRKLAALAVPEPGSRRDWRALRPSLWPLWVSAIVLAMIQQFDVVVVGSLLGTAEAGAYFVAQKTALLLSLVLIAAGLVTAPMIAGLYHANKHTELQQLCRNIAMLTAATTLVGFGFLVLLGEHLLAFVDPSYVSAYPVLLVIGFGCLIDAIAGPTAYLMQMTKFERPHLRVMIICYFMVLLAQLILVPRFGSMGAAVASAAGAVVWNVWAISILRRKAGFDPSLLALLVPPRRIAA